MLTFTTKAETLRTLTGQLKSAQVLPQVCLSVGEIQSDPRRVLFLLEQAGLLSRRLIVRSSARNEDTAESSNAGKFLSIADVAGEDAILDAVSQVVDAMGPEPANQVFIQPFLTNVELCGVAFTADTNTGGNYYILNYDDTTGSTSSVTDGTGAHLQTFYHFKGADALSLPSPLDRVIALCRELEELFQRPALDLEFAVAGGELYLLQVRPLVITKPLADLEDQKGFLRQIRDKLCTSMLPHPDLYGQRAVYGVMPDWNPAEMIGLHPRALALSMYKEIITNGVWAYQRDNYGYRNLRSFPLMVDFCGLPYIDARVSFNSFLPKTLPQPLAEKLVDYYLDRLRSHPEYHDKVEFEIAFTCYTFDLPKRVKALGKHGFTSEEQNCLVQALHEMTNSIIREDGLWRKDAQKIEILREKHRKIMASGLATVDKIYWLLEYCKRYGTLPFAGLARAGFIAVELLRSMVALGGITEEERSLYMNSLSTVGKNITRDLAALPSSEFLSKYGHLRPGTYDICSSRYDQGEELYFDFAHTQGGQEASQGEFKLTLKQYEFFQRILEEHKMSVDVLSLFQFIQNAIEGREYAKFVFTHTLSDALELLVDLGAGFGLSREDMSFVTIQRVMELYSSAGDLKEALNVSIREGRVLERKSASLILPPLLWEEEQIYSFFLPDGSPNFITQNRCTAETVLLPSEKPLEGKLVLIRGADPGYDWIFSHSIAGFITAYGGANSHMAIRAAEFGIPAVIGVGEKQFARYVSARCLEVDCRNRTVTIL